MQVSVESTGALGRVMKVQVPVDQVSVEISKRLQSMVKTVRLHGFRPGKVPLKVIQQRFGEQVRRDVIGELMQSSYLEALSQEKLRPAGAPRIETDDSSGATGLAYTVTFEVYPEFEVGPVDGLGITRPVVTISEEDVDGVIEKLRHQRRTWEPVERPAQEGDRLVVDFEGTVEGAAFEGNQGTDFAIELGTGRMIPGFEEALQGAAADSGRTVEVVFPDDYQETALAGKPAVFEVRVKSVAEPRLPPIDEAFAESFGVKEGGLDAFRKEVRSNMEREAAATISSRVKRQVMDLLVENNPVEAPRALIQEEISKLRDNAMRMTGAKDAGLFPDDQFEESARRRVILGLVISEVVQRQELKPDDDKIREILEGIAGGYEDPDQVIAYYRSHREAMAEVETLALEETVVDWVTERADVQEEPVDFADLTESGNSEATRS